MSNQKRHDEIYCRSCGEPIKKKAEICPECGVSNDKGGIQQSDQGYANSDFGVSSGLFVKYLAVKSTET